MFFPHPFEITAGIFIAVLKSRLSATQTYWDTSAFIYSNPFCWKIRLSFHLSGEQMELGRNGTDLLHVTCRFSIISVLKILFGHRIFVHLFCMSPCMFPAPCKELGTICSHTAVAYSWVCSWSTLSPISALETTVSLGSRSRYRCPQSWIAKSSCLNLSHHHQGHGRRSTQSASAHLGPSHRGSSLKPLLCPRDLWISHDPNRGGWQREQEPVRDSQGNTEQIQPCDTFEPAQCRSLSDSEILS